MREFEYSSEVTTQVAQVYSICDIFPLMNLNPYDGRQDKVPNITTMRLYRRRSSFAMMPPLLLDNTCYKPVREISLQPRALRDEALPNRRSDQSVKRQQNLLRYLAHLFAEVSRK